MCVYCDEGKEVKIMLSEKENNILEKAEDVILKQLEASLNGNQLISDSSFETLMDGIRTLDRICKMKYANQDGM